MPFKDLPQPLRRRGDGCTKYRYYRRDIWQDMDMKRLTEVHIDYCFVMQKTTEKT